VGAAPSIHIGAAPSREARAWRRVLARGLRVCPCRPTVEPDPALELLRRRFEVHGLLGGFDAHVQCYYECHEKREKEYRTFHLPFRDAWQIAAVVVAVAAVAAVNCIVAAIRGKNDNEDDGEETERQETKRQNKGGDGVPMPLVLRHIVFVPRMLKQPQLFLSALC